MQRKKFILYYVESIILVAVEYRDNLIFFTNCSKPLKYTIIKITQNPELIFIHYYWTLEVILKGQV